MCTVYLLWKKWQNKANHNKNKHKYPTVVQSLEICFFFFLLTTRIETNTPRQTHYDFVNCTTKTETESTEHTVNNVYYGHHTFNAKQNDRKLKTVERDTRRTQNTLEYIHIDKCMTMLVMVLIHIHIMNTSIDIENMKFTCIQKPMTVTSTHTQRPKCNYFHIFTVRIIHLNLWLVKLPHEHLFLVLNLLCLHDYRMNMWTHLYGCVCFCVWVYAKRATELMMNSVTHVCAWTITFI